MWGRIRTALGRTDERLGRIHLIVDSRQGGFTLIELLVVIIIIGILAAIAIPVFLAQRTKGYDAQGKSDVRNVATLEESYLASYNSYATTTALNTVPNTITLSANDTVAVWINGASNYCIVGKNALSKNYWVYTSSGGGLQPSPLTTSPLGTTAPAACAGAGTGTPTYATASATGLVTTPASAPSGF